MAGRGDDLEVDTEFGDRHVFPAQQGMGPAGNGFIARCVDRNGMAGQEFADAADMVGMVVGNQNGDRVKMPRRQPS